MGGLNIVTTAVVAVLVATALSETPPRPCSRDNVLHACRFGETDYVKQCATKDASLLQARDAVGCNLVVAAAMSGHLDTVEALYRLGADLNAACDSGRNAVDYALKQGHMDVVKYLRDLGVQRSGKPEQQACTQEEWFRAARTGDLTTMERCLLNGRDIESRDEAGCSAVVTAAINKHTNILQFLFQRGADLNAACGSGTTALMLAAKHGDLDVVKMLGRLGVDFEQEMGLEKQTALTFAAEHGHIGVAKHLHKLDMEFGTDWTGGGVMWAAAVGEVTLLETLLAEGREKLEARDEHGHTAVSWAAQNGHVNTLAVLKNKGANLEVRTHSGWTPLMGAAFNGHVPAMSFLLDNGVNINARDKAEWTALMWAAANNQLDAIDFLIESGASFEPNSHGWTPLLVAAAAGHKDGVSLLQRRGLNFRHRNRRGLSSEDLAAQAGHAELAEQFARMEHAYQHETKRARHNEL